MASPPQDSPGRREAIERERARKARQWAAGVPSGATRVDVGRLLGGKLGVHLDDVMALSPALGEVERAAAWLFGDKAVGPLAGKAAAIFHTCQAKDPLRH